MPFDKGPEQLDRLVDLAFQSPEFAERLGLVNPHALAKLRSMVHDQSAAVWDAAGADIQRADELETKLKEDQRQLSAVLDPKPLVFNVLKVACRQGIPFLGALSAGAYVVCGSFLGWEATWKYLAERHMVRLFIAALGSSSAALWLLYLGSMRQRRGRLRRSRDLRSADLKIAETEGQLERARSDAAQTVLREGVLRVLRLGIAQYLLPVYSVHLDIPFTPGLDSNTYGNLEIQTPAHERLLFLLSAMRGGSIGIAGPRGAGKSTLINSVCREGVRDVAGKPALTALTSAPVEYQPREFLLHLFASICHRVLERGSPSHDRLDWSSREGRREAPASTRNWTRLITWALVIGPLLVIASLGVALINIDAQSWQRASGKAVETRTIDHPQVAAGDAKGVATKAPTIPSYVDVALLMKEMGVRPIILWSLGIALLLFPIVARFVMNRCDGYFGVGQQLQRSVDGIPKDVAETAADRPRDRLIQAAKAWLVEIKFQQSYTTGWSGSLKIPLGLEGSVNEARSLAQQQLTLPELVDALARFLRDLSLDYVVIIGIDELDKIESDEKAQRFLNEIKAIFGITRVFYLVSMSENAMSRFERRGLPFRDAFDSAFDEVIAVDYMTFNTASLLLAERVIGLPVQFQALCYSMSGGLARELVRSCRDLVEHSRTGQNARDLKSLTLLIVTRQLRAKLRAATYASATIEDGEKHGFLELIADLQRQSTVTAEVLQRCAQRLYESLHRLKPRRIKDASPSGELLALTRSTAIYLTFLATILATFNSDLSEAVTSDAIESGRLDELAQSFQQIALNPNAAKATLDTWTIP